MDYREKIEAIWIFRNKRLISVLIGVFSCAVIFSLGAGLVLFNRLQTEDPFADFEINYAFHSLGQLRRETLRLTILIVSPPQNITSAELSLQLDLLESRVYIIKKHIKEKNIAPDLVKNLDDFYANWEYVNSIKDKIIVNKLNDVERGKLKQRLQEMELTINFITRQNEEYSREIHLHLLSLRKKIVISFIIFYILFLILVILSFLNGLHAAWERSKTLMSLELSEERYRKIVETAEEGIWTLDSTQNITFLNTKLTELLEYSSHQILGHSAFTLCPNSNDEMILLTHFETLMAEGAASQDIHLHSSQGKSLWFYISSTVINLNNEGEQNILSLLTDITERKKIEKALKDANIRLGYQANFDELTQIANRRYFNLHIIKVWRETCELKQPLSIVLVDIDFFKKYNDFYGHLQGDVCLFEVAQVISASAQRESNLAARYGGEEFVLVFPNTSQLEAMKIIENLQSEIQSLGIKHEKSLVSTIISLSMGIVTGIPHPGMTIEEALQLADQALYRAKEQGRDQYVTSSF